jgi:hypothetical protein
MSVVHKKPNSNSVQTRKSVEGRLRHGNVGETSRNVAKKKRKVRGHFWRTRQRDR